MARRALSPRCLPLAQPSCACVTIAVASSLDELCCFITTCLLQHTRLLTMADAWDDDAPVRQLTGHSDSQAPLTHLSHSPLAFHVSLFASGCRA